MRKWERSEGILKSNFEVNSKQIKKVKDKTDGGAYWHTEACKLFPSKFQMHCNAFIMKSVAN